MNELMLEDKGYIKEGARYTDIDAATTFDTETYLNAPSKVYGGNDEITRGGKNADK